MKIIKSRFQLKIGTSSNLKLPFLHIRGDKECFYFLKAGNKKSNQTCFQNSNLLKIKTIFKK